MDARARQPCLSARQVGREPEEEQSRGVALLRTLRAHSSDALLDLLDQTPNALLDQTSNAILDQTLCQKPEQVWDLGRFASRIVVEIRKRS